MTTTKLCTHAVSIAALLSASLATTGCIQGKRDSTRQNPDVKVFDVAPDLVRSGSQKAVPNTPENLELRARYAAVGVLTDEPKSAENWGLGFCTATLVGPRTVLTAAHCLLGLPSEKPIYFQIDRSVAIEAETVALYNDVAAKGDTDDIAVVTLTVDVPDVEPKPVGGAPQEVGKKTRIIGYGNDSSAGMSKDYGTKRIGYAEMSDVYPETIWTSIGSEAWARDGDSGGPLFVDDMKGGDILAGTIVGGYVSTSVSLYAEWIYDNSKGDVRFFDPLISGESQTRQIRTTSGLCLVYLSLPWFTSILATECPGTEVQSWDLQPQANGTYRIMSQGQSLTGGLQDSCISDAPLDEPINQVKLAASLADDMPSTCEPYQLKSQGWVLSKNSNDTYSIQTLNGMQCLSALKALEGGTAREVELEECNGSENQQWVLR